MHDKLRALIAQLRLHGMAEALDAEIERAERRSDRGTRAAVPAARPGGRLPP